MAQRIEDALLRLQSSNFRARFHLSEKDRQYIDEKGLATCCRGCLEKWYHVKKGIQLTSLQQEKIVNLIMAWIIREYKK